MKSWQKPTAEQISRVDRLTLRPQEERYFYSRLENPLWLDAMCDQGEMEPPEPSVDDDGTVSHMHWPFSAYLARVAGDHPDHHRVAAIIKQFADTENVFVQGDLIRAMATLDPSCITDLLPRVATWLAERPSAFLTMDLIGELCVAALNGRENGDAVKSLLRALFEPRYVGVVASYREPTIDWWETREFASHVLPKLIEQNWELTVSVFLDGLTDLIGAQAGSDSSRTSAYDFTSWWLPDPESEEDSRDTGEPLAYLAAQSLEAIALLPAVSPERVLLLLERGTWTVFRRLRLHYLSYRTSAGTVEQPMLAALSDPGRELEFPPSPEYDFLLKAAFERGSQEEQRVILQTLSSAAAGGGEQGDYWLFGRLAVISDDLPVEERSLFQRFVEKFGSPPQRDPQPSVKLESPEKLSPLHPGQAKSMTAFQLATYGRDWTQPAEDFSFAQPTWKGLAAEVEREAKDRPFEFSQAASSFVDIERTLVNALFCGLKEAVQDGSSIEWDSTLHLMRCIAPESEAIDETYEHRFGRDVSWYEAKRAAIDLLQTGLNREQSILLSHKKQIWRTIEVFAATGEAFYDRPLDDTRDSVYVALNSTRSQAAYAAVAYLLWLRRNESEELSRDVRAFFERILDPVLEPFIGMRAVVAHKLPQLAYVNEEWLIQLLQDIFLKASENPEHWSAAWDAYLRHSGPMPNRSLLKEMASLYRSAITGNNDRVVLLGIHLIAMFLRRDIELDDANLDAFFRRSPGPVRSRVYGWLGRVAGREELPDYWYDRARLFAEWREQQVKTDGLDSAELRMLGWLVATAKFDVGWWAPRLADALRSSTDNINDYIPLKPMMRAVAQASERYPGIALEALEIVVQQDESRLHRPYLDSADKIIANALSNPGTMQRARMAADSLARAGHDRFERFATETV